jgi:hypothetical protein
VERPRIQLAQRQGSATIAQAARAESARRLRSKRHRSSQKTDGVTGCELRPSLANFQKV